MASNYQKKRAIEIDRAWINQLVAEAQNSGWFGTLTFVFEDGQVKRGRQDKSLLPPSLKLNKPVKLR